MQYYEQYERTFCRKEDMPVTLDQLKPNETATVISIGGQGTLRHRLLEMGLTPGVTITLEKTAPLGDPIMLDLRGYALALRLADAKHIHVGSPHVHRQPVSLPHANTVSANTKGTFLTGDPIRLALAGNQNCGKTTLFNQLTGSNQHVGNFPGVTVDKKEGAIRRCPEIMVTDLPGIYSLSPYSDEEIVTRDFLISTPPAGIINIVDVSNLERSLYLTMQLMELDIPMVLALNMMDELQASGGAIDTKRLEEILGIPAVPISAIKNEGIDALVAAAMLVVRRRQLPGRIDFPTVSAPVPSCIRAAADLIAPYAKTADLPVPFAATKLLEGDLLMAQALKLPFDRQKALDKITARLLAETGLDRETALANWRFSFLETLCRETVSKPHESRGHRRSVAIDRVLTGKYTAFPCFLGIMALVFGMTFHVVGNRMSGFLSASLSGLIGLLDRGLTAAQVNPAVHALVVDGICRGVGSVLGFLPIIITLFFFLSILEDTGYMARVAFIMDKPMRRIGLSGRSFVPMLIGFGCSVPAIMATRTLPNARDRRVTILLTPFMSCSAKLPIYALFAAAFFPGKRQAAVMIFLFVFGILCGIIYALFLKNTRYQGEPAPFVMELPNYRMPSAKNICHLLWEKASGFLCKAFTVILIASVIIWFLQSFDVRLQAAATPEESLLARIGSLLAPVFAPLGFGDWRVCTALITGFIAKESVVSTLTVLLGGDAFRLHTLFTPFTGFIFLVFILLYTPCVAAIATVRREMGGKTAGVVVITQCAIAWFAALLIRIAGLLVGLT